MLRKYRKMSDDKKMNLIINMGVGDFEGLANSSVNAISTQEMQTKARRTVKGKEAMTKFERLNTMVMLNISQNPLSQWFSKFRTVSVSLFDSMYKAPVFLGGFQQEFKKITGEDVNIDKLANGDKEYMAKHKKAIKEASTIAIELYTQITTSGDTFGAVERTKVQAATGWVRNGTRMIQTANPVSVLADAADGLFFRYARQNNAGFWNGALKVANGEVRKGTAEMTASFAANTLYFTALQFMIPPLYKMIIGMWRGHEEDDEELLREIEDAYTNARNDDELMKLMFEFQTHLSEFPEDTDFRIGKIREMMDNKSFQDVMVYVYSKAVLDGLKESLINKMNTAMDIDKDMKDLTQPELIEKIAYLMFKGDGYTQEERKRLVEEGLTIIKNDLSPGILTSKIHEGDFNKDNAEGVAAIALNSILNYRTTKEQTIKAAKRGVNETIFMSGAGNIGNLGFNLFMAQADKYWAFMNERPYSVKDSDLGGAYELGKAYINYDTAPDKQNVRDEWQKMIFSTIKELNPRMMGYLTVIEDTFMNEEYWMNAMTVPAMLGIPYSQVVNQAHSKMRTSEIYKLHTGDTSIFTNEWLDEFFRKKPKDEAEAAAIKTQKKFPTLKSVDNRTQKTKERLEKERGN